MVDIIGADAPSYGVGGFVFASESGDFQVGSMNYFYKYMHLHYDERVSEVAFTWTNVPYSVEFRTNTGRSVKIGSGDGLHSEVVPI